MRLDSIPILVLDLGDFGQALEPPALTPVVQQVLADAGDLASPLDEAYGILDGQRSFVGQSTIDTTIDSLVTTQAAAAAPVDVDRLRVAEDGWLATRQLFAAYVPLVPKTGDDPASVVAATYRGSPINDDLTTGTTDTTNL